MSETTTYEFMVILTPENTEAMNRKVLSTIAKQIESHQGEVVREDIWGLRNLAYRIKKQEKGYYAVLLINIPSDALIEFKEFLKLENDVLRYLITVPPDSYEPIDYQTMKKEEERLGQKKIAMAEEKKPVKEKVKPAPKKVEIVEKIKDEEPKEPKKELTPEEIKAKEAKLEEVLAKVQKESKEETPPEEEKKETTITDDFDKKLAKILENDKI